MAANGPRIMAFCYSEGPVGGSSPTGPDANATVATIESATPGTTTYGRPTAPALFTDQLQDIETEWDASAPAGLYSLTYDASTERVTIASTNSTSFKPQFEGNTAVWFGFTQSIVGNNTTWTADDPPAGLAELFAVTVEPAEDFARVQLAEYRHGRSVASVWGNHQVHRVRLVFRNSTYAQIAAGYLTTGRVRIWQCGDGTAYSATNIDGFVDGYVLAADDPVEEGDDGELWSLRLLIGVSR